MGPRFRPSLPWTPNVDFTGRPWGICSVPALPIRIKLKNRASSCQRGSFISNLSAAILSDSFARVDACGSCVPHDLHHRIIVGQNADKEVVGRRPLATEVTQRAAGELVAPDVCAQKCPRQGAAHPASIVSEVEVPQRLGGYLLFIVALSYVLREVPLHEFSTLGKGSTTVTSSVGCWSRSTGVLPSGSALSLLRGSHSYNALIKACAGESTMLATTGPARFRALFRN
jgi:hypothetical protein